MQSERHLGLFGATAIGVGAIVGGGILALAGVAFAATGPAAIIAFAANGAIAAVTAVTFARLAKAFPESGGTYTYAKKVLSVEVAFTVGWVVWFASIVAAVLYALGFAAFAIEMAARLAERGGSAPEWLDARPIRVALALAATSFYAVGLVRRSAGGGQWVTVTKVVVFVVLVVGGAVAFASTPLRESTRPLTPFFTAGALGLVQAMGYTFIALQGFDLIAAAGGEVRDPSRNLPRSIYLSLGIALTIYLPLLFLVATVGVAPGRTIAGMAAENPEGVIAWAAERFLGPTGYWLVIVAGLLSMLSALEANLFGASRVAFAMARDRSLPRVLGRVRAGSGTPAVAVVVTSVAAAVIIAVIPDVAAAGAASSLIFLVSFAMAHWAAILAGRRSGVRRFPTVPVVGVCACLGLAIFQGFAVSAAGTLATLWLGIGVALYLTLLAPGSRTADASAQARDPELVRLRGRKPLVLVPIANPASAGGLVSIGGAVATPNVGRLLLLSVVGPPENWTAEDPGESVRNAQAVLGQSLHAGLGRQLAHETLVTVAPDPWREIARVARAHRCETLLLGLSRLDSPGLETKLEDLAGTVESDVIVLRASAGWELEGVKKVLVPLGGRRDHSRLRARLLGSLSRSAERELVFLRVLPAAASEDEMTRARREIEALARDEAAGPYRVEIIRSADPSAELVAHAAEHDLVVMGVRRVGHRGRRRAFGELALRVARATDRPLVLISRRG